MTKLYEAWKKEAQRLRDFETEKIPVAVRRCPKCMNLSVEVDVQKGTAKCTRCGFEVKFKMAKV